MLLIQGRDDEYGTLEQLDRIAARGASSRVEARARPCGHSPHRDQAAAVLDAIVAFAKDIRRVSARPPPEGRPRMSKTFASTGDIAEKKITFAEIGRGLYAFTAEGDPNSGVIIGDDGVIVIDAQATPAMAGQVIERVAQGHRQAHQVRGAVALSRRARAGRLGLQGAGDHGLGRLPLHDRRARQGGLGFRVRPLPAPVPRRRDPSRG